MAPTKDMTPPKKRLFSDFVRPSKIDGNGKFFKIPVSNKSPINKSIKPIQRIIKLIFFMLEFRISWFIKL